MKKAAELIVVEVPHQDSPKVWVAENEEEIIAAAENTHGMLYEEGSYDAGEKPDFFELAKEALGHDLHSLLIMTRDEAESWVSDPKNQSSHQGIKIFVTMCKGALAEKLESIARVRGIECDIHMHKLNYFELVHP